jgi:hypothetical protein
MSDISTVYDAIIASANTLFASKTRLHNPYEISDNAEIITKDAWGLKVNGAERLDIEFCNLSISRQYTLLLMRHFPTVGSAKDAFDSISKSLLEDQQTFLNALWSPHELGVESEVDRIDINSIGGIEFNVSDQKKYLFIELTFTITLSTAVI